MSAIPDFNDPRPVFEQIAADLREQIRSGRLAVGTRLRSQAELAKEYGVAPNTLRTALKELAVEGLISTRSTRGTFVKKTPREPEPSVTDVLEYMKRLSERVEHLESRMDALESDEPDHRS